MTVLANDTFTGTNGTLLTAHTADSGQAWAKTTNGNYPGDAQIATNRLRSSSANYYLHALGYTPPSADYAVVASFVINTVLGGDIQSITIRTDANAVSFYSLDVIPSNNTYYLYRFLNGGYALLGTYQPGTALAAGQSHTVELRAVGGAIVALIDGTSRIFAVDTSVSAVGKPGVRGGGAAQTDSTGTHIDTLQVTDIPAGTIAAPTLSTATPRAGAVDLDWTDVVDANLHGYVMEYKRSVDSTYLYGGSSLTSAGRVSSLTAGTAYDFRVRSQSTDATMGTASNVLSATPTAAAALPAGWNDITGTHSGAVTPGVPGLLALKQAHQYVNDFSTSLEAGGALAVSGPNPPALTAGRMRVPFPAVAGTNAVSSVAQFDLSNSHFHLEAPVAPAAANPAADLSFTLLTNLEDPYFYLHGGSIYYHDGFNLGSPTTYDATAMRWLQFREAAGTLYMETSPDGTTWTIRKQFAVFFDPTTVRWQVSAGYASGAQPNPAFVEIDNFNTVTSATGTAKTNLAADYAGGKTTFAYDAVFNVGNVLTCRAVVLPDTLPAGGTLRAIIDRPNHVQLRMNGAALEGIVYVGGVARTVTASAVFVAGEIVDVAVRYDGANVQLFKNGAAVGSPVAIAGTVDTATTDVTIGNVAASNQAFDGRIQLPEILGEALTAGRLAADFADVSGTAGAVPPPPPPPPPPPVLAKLETLQDTFASGSVDLAKWAIPTPQGLELPIRVVNQQLLVPTTGNYPTISSVSAYDFTGSFFGMNVVSEPTGDIGDQSSILVRSTVHPNAQLQFIYADPAPQKLRAQYMGAAGLWVDVATATLDVSAHAWRRIRESGGTIIWEVSADGAVWSTFASVAWSASGWATSDLQSVRAYIFSGNYNGLSGRADFIVDTINLAPSPTPPGQPVPPAAIVVSRPDLWPDGTIVAAYPRNAVVAGSQTPTAAPVEVQTVTAGAVTFVSLSADAGYVLHALVGGAPRTVQVRVKSTSVAETGRATGTGNTSAGSLSVTAVNTVTGAFQIGQRIAGPGIEAGTRIRNISGSTLTLTNAAKATGTGVGLEASDARTAVGRNLRRRAALNTS